MILTSACASGWHENCIGLARLADGGDWPCGCHCHRKEPGVYQTEGGSE